MAIWNPRANEIFASILELPGTQWQPYLDQACGGDAELRQQVEALLTAHAQAGRFLDRPVNPAEMETVAPDANGVDPLLGIVRYVGDYELLAELGRGGMGVVYKARQASLQRLVALKMILAGGHAGPTHLARFRTECEAIARLQHPNIVQIHEVGEHEGKPFFSMEFCPGGGLDKRLNGTPWQPGEAAHLVETLARAMQAAHANNVIHRDLKPANVLLGGDETPKITDFGLAKKLDEVGQTASGDIMGTPSYMAPEQAGMANPGHPAVGPASDIYALGAILYELLTGRPPFKAATHLDTIFQVVNNEPVPPRQLQSTIPVDLETICLKCLEKDPTKRYASAVKLTEDLKRFQAGVPVLARPVGRLERAAKWVRRNPVVASLTAVVALVLVVGAGVSTYFAFAASKQASEAIVARNELGKKADDLAASRDLLETVLARSLLRPLAVLGHGWELTEPEWEALWELATSRPGRVGYRFVEEATRAPGTTRQLRDRAAWALPAAVGLDLQRCEEVNTLLLDRFQDATLSEEHKTDLAQAAATWDGLSIAGARAASRHLAFVMTRTKDPNTLKLLVEGLTVLLARLDAREGGEVAVQAAAILLQAMKVAQAAVLLTQQDLKDTNDCQTMLTLSQGLAILSVRLEAGDASRVAGEATLLITQVMKGIKQASALDYLGQGLRAVAVRLQPKEAILATSNLNQAIKNPQDWYALMVLARGLATVGEHLEPTEAAQVASTLLQALNGRKESNAVASVVQDLTALLSRLSARDAEGVAAQAAAIVIQHVKVSRDNGGLSTLAQRLTAVSAHLNAKDASQFAPLLAVILTQIIKDNYVGDYALTALAQSLGALSARLEPPEASQVAATLLRALKWTTEPTKVRDLAESLKAVTVRLEPREAARILGQTAIKLTQAMKVKIDTGSSVESLARVLTDMAGCLEPDDAAEAAALLAQAMKSARDSQDLYWLAYGLVRIAPRLEPQEATRLAGQAATILTQGIKVNSNPQTLQMLAGGLAVLAARLEPKAAAQAAAILTQAMKDTKEPLTLFHLAQSLTFVAARLPPVESAAILTQAMKDTKEPSALSAQARGLSKVAGRLEPVEAAQIRILAATNLIQAMKDTRDASALMHLTESLHVVATHLEPNEAARLAAQGAAILAERIKGTNSTELSWLAKGLMAVAALLEPEKAAQAAAILISVKAKNQQAIDAGSFSLLLTEVPTTTVQARSMAVATVLSSAADTSHPFVAVALLSKAEPLPCRLSTPQLVNLLKVPTCQGETARVILDHLGNRYKRRFADVWEFVRFATEQRLDLDFTGPLRPETMSIEGKAWILK